MRSCGTEVCDRLDRIRWGGIENVDPELVRRGRSFFFSDSWTGTGEVFGMYRLIKFFTEAGHPLKVVRSRALAFADLRDANVVFLGSPWANDMPDKINPGRTPTRSRRPSGGSGIRVAPSRDGLPGSCRRC